MHDSGYHIWGSRVDVNARSMSERVSGLCIIFEAQSLTLDVRIFIWTPNFTATFMYAPSDR